MLGQTRGASRIVTQKGGAQPIAGAHQFLPDLSGKTHLGPDMVCEALVRLPDAIAPAIGPQDVGD